LFDEFPTAYVPSAHIMAAVSQPYGAVPTQTAMLIVGETLPRLDVPAKRISQEDAIQLASAERGHRRDLLNFPKLRFSGTECNQVQSALTPVFRGEFLNLRSDQAIEKRVKREFAKDNRRISCLLFSCHGFAESEEHTNQLFGALVLSPPDKKSAADDGLLHLPEIHQLAMGGCELAVLSACETVVGAERPMESGSTLARSFMVAGANRVVCSHWSVNDRSTSELVTRFFENVAIQATGESDEINLAVALHAARQHVRSLGADSASYSSPYYWAPFVLIGPPIVKKDQLLGSAN
jgi:CHAT domain-containing protein